VPVSKGLRARGAARPAVTLLFVAVYVMSDVFDPVTVQSLRVILCANRTITTPQKINKIATFTGLGPSIIVLLHSCSTPTSLRTIRRLYAGVENAILTTLATILCITDGRNNRGQLTVKLWTDVLPDGRHIPSRLGETVLGYDSLVVGLGVAGEGEEQSSKESHGYHYTYLSAGFQQDFRGLARKPIAD